MQRQQDTIDGQHSLQTGEQLCFELGVTIGGQRATRIGAGKQDRHESGATLTQRLQHTTDHPALYGQQFVPAIELTTLEGGQVNRHAAEFVAFGQDAGNGDTLGAHNGAFLSDKDRIKVTGKRYHKAAEPQRRKAAELQRRKAAELQ